MKNFLTRRLRDSDVEDFAFPVGSDIRNAFPPAGEYFKILFDTGAELQTCIDKHHRIRAGKRKLREFYQANGLQADDIVYIQIIEPLRVYYFSAEPPIVSPNLSKKGLESKSSGPSPRQALFEQTLDNDEFMELVEHELRFKLSDKINLLEPQVLRKSNKIELRLSPFTVCVYRLVLGQDTTLIGLEFLSTPKWNRFHTQAFAPHLESLSKELNQIVKCSNDSQGRHARVHIEVASRILDMSLANACSRLLNEFIELTVPILESAYTTDSVSCQSEIGSKSVEEEFGDAYEVFLRKIETILDFLEGHCALRPSSEEICDWIYLCYSFEIYLLGSELFPLVSREDVNEWYYERTRKLAKICAMKAQS